MSGFGNEFSSEDPRCPGALPEGQVFKILRNGFDQKTRELFSLAFLEDLRDITL